MGSIIRVRSVSIKYEEWKGETMKKSIWICAAIVAVLAIVFAVIKLGGNSADEKTAAPEAEATDLVIVPDADRETFEIPFAGLVLKYPKEWQDQVTIKEQDGSLVFSVKGATLFTLYADDQHDTLGTVVGETNTVISVEMEEIDPDETEKAAMQEDINVILLHLTKDYNFQTATAEVAVPDENYELLPISTSVTTLYYPAKWQDQVKIEVTDDKVSFSADGTPLFDVVFAECDGKLLGTYGGTPIYVVEYEVTDEEHALMQMGINDILEHLMEDNQFVLNG